MTGPHDALDIAVEHHRAGRLAEAGRIYRLVLDRHPDHPDAHHLLGLVVSAEGRADEAAARIARSLALRPDVADPWYNLGNLQRRRGARAAAIAAFARAEALVPAERNRLFQGVTHAEHAADLAGGMKALMAHFNAFHARNRSLPAWRHDFLAHALGAEVRARVLAHTEAALRLAPRDGTAMYIAMLVFMAAGEPERARAVLEVSGGDANPDLSRLAAEVTWYLRDAAGARAHYLTFVERTCAAPVELRPLHPEVAGAARYRNRPSGGAAAGRGGGSGGGGGPVLIYTHYGNPDYLHYGIGQNRIACPDARIVLIGNNENRIDGIEHRTIAQHFALAREVVVRYTHDSGNGFCYELFCIVRWFVFLDFCRREKLSEVFFLDSDYMLFGDPMQDIERFRAAGAAFSLNSAHFSYFTVDRLEEFCAHILAFFRAGRDTASFWAANNSELFSDMAFIFDYQRNHPWRNLCTLEDDAFYDYSITGSDGFRTMPDPHCGTIKDVWLEDGQPWCVHEATGRPVRFRGLHFQGHSKPRMRDLFLHHPWGKPPA